MTLPVPGSFVFTTVAMVTCAAISTVTLGTGGGLSKLVFQFGALGLCAYMVFQNYRDRRAATLTNEQQRQELLRALQEKEQENTEQRKRLEELYQQTLEVFRGKIKF